MFWFMLYSNITIDGIQNSSKITLLFGEYSTELVHYSYQQIMIEQIFIQFAAKIGIFSLKNKKIRTLFLNFILINVLLHPIKQYMKRNYSCSEILIWNGKIAMNKTLCIISKENIKVE